MAIEARLEIDQQVFIDEVEHQFKRLISPSTPETDSRRNLQFEEVRTGHRFTMTHAAYDALILAHKIRCPSPLDRPGDEMPEKEGRDAGVRDLRQALLREFDANPVPKTDKALTKFVKDTMARLKIDSDWTPSGATLRTWSRTRGEPGRRPRKHMGRRQEFGVRKKRIDPVAEDLIKAKSDELYFRKIGMNTKDVYAAVRTRLSTINKEREEKGLSPIRPPGRTTVWRRVAEDTKFEKARRRYGSKKANAMFKPLASYEKPKRILETVIIDETVIDCHVRDQDFPVTVGRPHLAIAFDSFSRCVVGCLLGFVAPSVETAMATLRDVVRPKSDLKAQFPTLRGNLLGGVPETVVYDRAWGQVGSSMNDALDDVGISVVHAPAGTPQFKGRGEHFFDTLNKRLFHKLPGAVPFKPHDLKEHELDPVAEARISLSDLRELTLQAVIDYNNDFHTGLGDVPARLWNEQASRYGIQYPLDLLAIDMACAKLAPPRILSSNGIELHGVRYCGPKVFDLLNDMLPLAPKRARRPGTLWVKVKYLPEDISKIFVWNTLRQKYVEIPCLEQRYTRGLSEYHHAKVEAFRVERALTWSSEDDRCRARTLLNQDALSTLNSRQIGNRRRSQRTIDRIQPSNNPNGRLVANSDTTVIPVESVSNRANGDHPERARVRRGAARKTGRDHGKNASQITTVTSSRGEVPDPFADFDRAELISTLENEP